MEIKTEGIVLRAADYKDNDKLFTLFSPTLGKITAGIRGVKKPTAKLHFSAQPFAFCEYVLAKSGGRYTVTGAYLYDGFFELRSDILRYYAACTLLEIVSGAVAEEQNEGVFVALAEGLKSLAHAQSDEAEAVLTFCLSTLAQTGYMLDLDGCGNCGNDVGEAPHFDFSAGCFLCDECADGVRASRSTYEVLRACAGLAYDEKRCAGGRKRALRLIKAFLSEKTENDYSCFGEFIRLYEEK